MLRVAWFFSLRCLFHEQVLFWRKTLLVSGSVWMYTYTYVWWDEIVWLSMWLISHSSTLSQCKGSYFWLTTFGTHLELYKGIILPISLFSFRSL